MRTDRIDSAGVRLRVGHTEPDPALSTVLFVNAVGMEVTLAAGLAAAFRAAGFNFVTWDLRGSPGPAPDLRDCALRTQADDGVRVLDALGVGPVHVLGWCTGASIGLFLAERLGERMCSIVAADGAFLFNGFPGAPLGNAMFEMCGEIVGDQRTAPRYHELTRPRGNEAAVLGLQDRPELVDHLTLPYRQSLDVLVRYAFAIRAACDYDPVRMCGQLARPALLTARHDDRMVSHRNSLRAVEHIGDARVRIDEHGGHYGLFTDDTIVADLAAFMRSVEPSPVPPPRR